MNCLELASDHSNPDGADYDPITEKYHGGPEKNVKRDNVALSNAFPSPRTCATPKKKGRTHCLFGN